MIEKSKVLERARQHAPYLAESLDLFPDIAEGLNFENPDQTIGQIYQSLPAERGSLNSEMASLRIFKRRIHLATALFDISGVWNWIDVTQCLTQLADYCVSRLLACSVADQKLEVCDPDNPLPGLFILAVGKYGAYELNYSSDIDFNVFYDPDRIALDRSARTERVLIRLVRSLIRGLEAITEDGYIFRTDLRLRPDPRSNSVAVSTRTAERYYVSLGQNWERAAMIKARVCAGDRSVGQSFVDDVLNPFIWRRNLDYAAIEDILAMKRQIHAVKGHDNIRVRGHDIKVGRGGIREIEFYAQTQQLILGGRDADLRTPRTVDALARLAEKAYVETEICQNLTGHYSRLRDWEHRIQMREDAQCHAIPVEESDVTALAALSGFSDAIEFEREVFKTLNSVSELFSNLFPEVEGLSSREGNLVFTGVELGQQTRQTLERLGFRRPDDVWTSMAQWLGGRIPATRSERARELLTHLAPRLIDGCADTGRPDEAFFAFSEFMSNLKGGVNVLSMFQQHPDRLQFVIRLLALSPRITDVLSSQPEILDVLSDPNFLDIIPEKLGEAYDPHIGSGETFEDHLNLARQLVREDQFRVSASVLSGQLRLEQLGVAFTEIAESTIQALLPVAIAEVERVSGRIPGDVGVLGMGKLGGRELSLNSDLDIMLIYESHRPGEGDSRIFSKVTQRLITALSAFTQEGGMFEVDMALRPSGRAGPVAVSTDAFTSYYSEHAWTWEFMALSRSRVIAANSDVFHLKLQELRDRALMAERPDLDMPYDIADMLRRVRREKPPKHSWDIKNMLGGLRDVEFIAQSLVLSMDREVSKQFVSTYDMLTHAKSKGDISSKNFSVLQKALALFHRVRQAEAMVAHAAGSEIKRSDKLTISHLLGQSIGQTEDELKASAKAVSKLVDLYVFERT